MKDAASGSVILEERDSYKSRKFSPVLMSLELTGWH